MQLNQFKTLDAGQRVQGFLDGQAGAIGSIVSPARRARLDAVVAQLSGFQYEQGMTRSTAVGETSNQDALRRDLYDGFMVPIGRLANAVLPGVSELDRLVVPAESVNTGRVGEFMTNANNFADASAKYEQVFIANGLPADFVAQIRAAISKLTASMTTRNDHVGRRAAATGGLTAMERAVRVEIGIIDGLLKVLLKSNPSLRSQWKVSKRIIRTAVTPHPTGAAPETSTDVSADGPTSPATSPLLSIADGTKAAA